MAAQHSERLAIAALGAGLGAAALLALLRVRWRRGLLAAPWLRLLTDPAADYVPSTPPWLAVAAAVAACAPTDDERRTALPPPVAAAAAALAEAAAAGGVEALLGAAAREQLFMLEPGVVYLNHGSYGAALRLAVEAQRHFQERLEAQPVRFMEEEALAGVRAAQLAVAELVGAEPRDLVFLPNATTAVNAVLRSLQLRPGDLILIATTTYPAVRSAAVRVAAAAGAALLEVDLLDVLDDEAAILRRYGAALQAGGGRVRLAILDHIVSMPPVQLPVAALCALCAGAGAATLVDGAHAVGALPLSLPSLGCSYYTSNLHKWACTPKGAAFLWAERSRQRLLCPLVTSHGYGLGFQGEWLWAGTTDLTPVLAVPTALAVLRALEPGASVYRRSLLRRAAALLHAAWGTAGALGMQAPDACMCAVEVPRVSGRTPCPRLAAALHDALRRRYSIEVPVACIGGRLWCRISAQIYNELADYEKLADAVLELVAEGGC